MRDSLCFPLFVLQKRGIFRLLLFWLGHYELAVGIVLGEYLGYLHLQVGAVCLPHGVVELLAVDEAQVVLVPCPPYPLVGADVGEGDESVVLELRPCLLRVRVAGQVVVLEQGPEVDGEPLLLVALPQPQASP